MGQYTDLIILFSGITIVFFLALILKKSTIFIHFLVRGILCTLIIYFANMGFASANMSVSLGYNSATLLTSGILGFPGVLLLFGIKLYKLL